MQILQGIFFISRSLTHYICKDPVLDKVIFASSRYENLIIWGTISQLTAGMKAPRTQVGKVRIPVP
jgi:hypothetical protein